MLKVALIWPYGYNPFSTLPLSLGYLRSNLGQDSSNYDVRIFDCALHNVEPQGKALQEFLVDFKPDIVGVTAWAREAEFALSILKQAKSLVPSATTIAGGYHATLYADKVMESHREVDFLFRGEGEQTFPRFLDQFQRTSPDYTMINGLMYRDSDKGFVKNEIEYIHDLDSIAWPDYDAIDLEGYFKHGYRHMSPKRRHVPLIATRGCPYRCTFCSAPLSVGKRIRKHSIEYLTEQISYLYHQKNIRWFNFIDDNFTNDVEFAKELCRAVINMDIKGTGFGTPSGVRMKKDALELWQLMKRAGWQYVIVAPESGSQRVLDKMKKDIKLETVPGVLHDIKNAGLGVMGFFMFGYPGETKQDLEKTIAFIKKNQFDYVSMHNFQPIPGTPVYDELVSQGEIEEGILPKKFTYGERAYTPPELEKVNFQLLFVKMYLFFLLRRPSMFLTILSGLNVFHSLRSFALNSLIATGIALRSLLRKLIPSR